MTYDDDIHDLLKTTSENRFMEVMMGEREKKAKGDNKRQFIVKTAFYSDICFGCALIVFFQAKVSASSRF
jgi:hypothetical protein